LLSRTRARTRPRVAVRDSNDTAGARTSSIQSRNLNRPARAALVVSKTTEYVPGPGMHRLELRVSDRQEAKNNENVPHMLPNTRVVMATIRVPR